MFILCLSLDSWDTQLCEVGTTASMGKSTSLRRAARRGLGVYEPVRLKAEFLKTF